jgi:hypothetical protein
MIAVELVPMLIVLQLIATLTATLFAGAALYIHVAEHPARMTLDAKAAALQWADSYRRATWVQAPLAVLSFASGMAAWLLTFDAAWLVAAVLIGAVVPFTLVVVMPTNRQLLDSRSDRTGAETRTLLQKWNRLHAVRTAFGVASSLIYLWSLRPP